MLIPLAKLCARLRIDAESPVALVNVVMSNVPLPVRESTDPAEDVDKRLRPFETKDIADPGLVP